MNFFQSWLDNTLTYMDLLRLLPDALLQILALKTQIREVAGGMPGWKASLWLEVRPPKKVALPAQLDTLQVLAASFRQGLLLVVASMVLMQANFLQQLRMTGSPDAGEMAPHPEDIHPLAQHHTRQLVLLEGLLVHLSNPSLGGSYLALVQLGSHLTEEAHFWATLLQDKEATLHRSFWHEVPARCNPWNCPTYMALEGQVASLRRVPPFLRRLAHSVGLFRRFSLECGFSVLPAGTLLPSRLPPASQDIYEPMASWLVAQQSAEREESALGANAPAPGPPVAPCWNDAINHLWRDLASMREALMTYNALLLLLDAQRRLLPVPSPDPEPVASPDGQPPPALRLSMDRWFPRCGSPARVAVANPLPDLTAAIGRVETLFIAFKRTSKSALARMWAARAPGEDPDLAMPVEDVCADRRVQRFDHLIGRLALEIRCLGREDAPPAGVAEAEHLQALLAQEGEFLLQTTTRAHTIRRSVGQPDLMGRVDAVLCDLQQHARELGRLAGRVEDFVGDALARPPGVPMDLAKRLLFEDEAGAVRGQAARLPVRVDLPTPADDVPDTADRLLCPEGQAHQERLFRMHAPLLAGPLAAAMYASSVEHFSLRLDVLLRPRRRTLASQLASLWKFATCLP
ncbi:hypothetical protein H696_05728 [Fonticula alba]|uniref:Uncharacterized protein n=1 Tax=Fonticula alba TaxID=691883 RepID=A0A058Z0X1_FONAL|nr:hypothetical protein H696_05728 [Fonticula alba]KCV67786.1 hypothetical protein H696_05728 [Fonticula alba]|eukprot:XP_009497817.1 hypothetical protein H696_05728 [Fonticula alba]